MQEMTSKVTAEERIESLHRYLARFKAHDQMVVEDGQMSAEENASAKAVMDQASMDLEKDLLATVQIDMSDPLQAQTVLGVVVMLNLVQVGVMEDIRSGEIPPEEADAVTENALPLTLDNMIHLALAKHGVDVKPDCPCKGHE